tara:strand:+ start:650 stop:1276 length:627 start_codon:yes stop_codon:yes gene_type:complete
MSKYVRMTSPTGLAKYPKLNEADFKFKKQEGQFSVSLIYTPEEGKSFISELDKIFKSEMAAEQQHSGKKKLKLSPYVKWGKELDEEENETGNYFVKFNMNHKYFNKQNELAFEKRPVIYNDKAQIDTESVIGGGSKIKVRFEAHRYNTTIGFGLTLHPIAAQIIELHTGGGDGMGHGFTSQEEEKVNGGESFPEEVFASANAGDTADF